MNLNRHYMLAVHYSPNARRRVRFAIRTAINVAGGLKHALYPAATKAAKALSKTPGVDRVVMTWVYQTHEGTWVGGRKERRR